MDITVLHRDFKTQLLVIRTTNWFASARVILNGLTVKSDRGQFLMHNDAGVDVVIRLKHKFLDAIPVVTIDGEDVHLASSSGWGKSTLGQLPPATHS